MLGLYEWNFSATAELAVGLMLGALVILAVIA